MDPLQQLADWPVTTACAVVLGPGGTLAWRGGPEVLPWASVTKLVTALVVLDAAEQGLLALDEPAGPRGSTVRHLLAHASGLGPDTDRSFAAPGRHRLYSNRGYEVLAELVSTRSGEDFAVRTYERILRPLGMTTAELVGSPAHGIEGTIVDLGRLGAELLAPTRIPADLFAEATTTAFPGLAGVLPGFGRQRPNDWGLGFEIRDGKDPHWTGSRNSPRTFGHFGMSGSFLWVDPAAGLACAVLTDRAFDDWAVEAWPALSDAVLGAAAGSSGN